jgi:hypothetical protein
MLIYCLHFNTDFRTQQNSPHQLTDMGDFEFMRCAIYRDYSLHQNSGFYNEQTGWAVLLSAQKKKGDAFQLSPETASEF